MFTGVSELCAIPMYWVCKDVIVSYSINEMNGMNRLVTIEYILWRFEFATSMGSELLNESFIDLIDGYVSCTF